MRARNPLYIMAKPPPEVQAQIAALPRNDPSRGPDPVSYTHLDVYKRQVYGDYIRFDERKFEEIYNNICKFMDRSSAEEDDTVKQFVTFTLVVHGRKILIYRRGKFTTTSERLKGQLSVGFGGHVNDSDFDLFSQGKNAFRANAARELKEELFLDEIYRERNDACLLYTSRCV